MRLLTTTAVVALATMACLVDAQEQKPLTGTHDTARSKFNLREQDSELCDSGARQWTGTVNVTSEKSMFFCEPDTVIFRRPFTDVLGYFESRHSPETDPLLLWMSGGPGGAGELGIFLGSGPCAVNHDGNSTRRLDYSWIDRANVVYIDQPIGVGFSKITDRDSIAVSLQEGARDVHEFLSIFSAQVFPDLAGRPWHITGESMGGHYVTGYTHYMASLGRDMAAQGLESPINVSSAIIVDGYIDATRQIVGYYDFFCTDWAADGRESPLMNDTACSDMAAAIPTCELMGAHCRETYSIKTCHAAYETCDLTVSQYLIDEIRPGGWDPYDSRHPCETPPECSNFGHGATWRFFNQPWVQKKLGFRPFPFELIDLDTNSRWDRAGNIYLPVTEELTWILDNTDIRVLFINGNNDIIINTPGQMRMLDEQPWKDQTQYQDLDYEEWRFKDGELTAGTDLENTQRGGFWKGTDRLSLYAVDEAGHFAPRHQPEAIGAVIRRWLHG
ncbi:hypothetical protein FZEAL_8569 [Fusarium zealandicum]|uniref:Carboxypeptidase Y n=1 Tax=Fusarium zealandicum TaxID=1053134 RepID=A0A8H4UEK1_9HYPO|nr:hypothetical protein FZEAL_8569 [Fusarium zealandicum]